MAHLTTQQRVRPRISPRERAKPCPSMTVDRECRRRLQGHEVTEELFLHPSAGYQPAAVCAPESHLHVDTETTRTAHVASSEEEPSTSMVHRFSDAYKNALTLTQTHCARDPVAVILCSQRLTTSSNSRAARARVLRRRSKQPSNRNAAERSGGVRDVQVLAWLRQ